MTVTRQALLVAGWVLVAAMLAVVALRLSDTSADTTEIRVLSVTPLLLLPAFPIAVAAGVRRRWALVAGCAVVAAAEVVWVGPQVAPWSSAQPAASAARLRVFDANVSQDNRNLADIAGEIASTRPQVVALEELTPAGYASLQRTGVMVRFGHRRVDVEGGPGGMGLWSTLPLDGATSWTNGTGQVELQAAVAFAGRAVQINVAHVFAPLGRHQPGLWRAQLGRLAARYAHEPGPIVVAGDLNATADLPPYRAILSYGPAGPGGRQQRLADAAVLAGDGWAMTWPRDQAHVPAYLRIDHVLISPDLTVTAYHLGTGRGSDHRPIIADLAWARR